VRPEGLDGIDEQMNKSPSSDLRELIIKIALMQQPKHQSESSLQQNSVLKAVGQQLGRPHDREFEQTILTEWHDLFRTGYFSWGYDLSNPGPPFFHFTERGRRAVERFGRDPGNPSGYVRYLNEVATLNGIAHSYVAEGLDCFVGGLYKAAAVMIGAAAESLVLELRDVARKRLSNTGQQESRGLADFRVKTVFDTLNRLLDIKKVEFGRELREEFDAFWPAFAHHIRVTRNDAGHPTSVDPVTEEAVHASFLIFPDLARLQNKLATWASTSL
jgi:hypothetical protein